MVMSDVAWAEPGNAVLFSRTLNGLTNIWKYSLRDRSLTQVTFGTGPDYSPMPDPVGKGIYYVNGNRERTLEGHCERGVTGAMSKHGQPIVKFPSFQIWFP